MKVSLNSIKRLVDFELPPKHELIERINQQLGGVEETIDFEEKYKGIVIVRVVSAVKHPNADKLTVCMVDDGGAVDGVERNDDGFVQVVCGAPNVTEGMVAVWLPPGVTVPASVDSGEPFVLSARELRGVVSNGMLAAADELGIGTDHEGIVSLDVSDLPDGIEDRALSPGQDFAEAFGLDDTIIDIENKMFTHRPDCFGQLGVAREIAGILHHEFTSPQWYIDTPTNESADEIDLEVFNDADTDVPRFMAVGLSDIVVKPSPFWLKCELVRMGSKPINNVVDITNYMMLLTGQPLHAYDYDKLRGWKLGARHARPGETITLINGKTYELDEADVVIADNEDAVGLGGVMGGADTEVSDSTTTVVLECATFDMYTIRRTSMRHGLFTDAVTRFNKGQSPLQTAPILSMALDWLRTLANAKLASSVSDEFESEAVAERTPVNIRTAFISSRLGKEFTADEVAALLRNVEIPVMMSGKDSSLMEIHVPFWRTDIDLPEDIVEEVGRLYGLDRLPRELPVRRMSPAGRNKAIELKKDVRASLAKSGGNEVLTYSFVHRRTLERAGQNPDHAYRLSNALSPDLQYYRLSVLPSLLDKVHGNIKSGYDEILLYEIGKGHNKSLPADSDDLPAEATYVDVVYANRQEQSGAPFYRARRVTEQLARDLSVTPLFVPVTEALDVATTAPYDLSRSALITTRQGDIFGIVGELQQSVIKKFKLPHYCAAISIDFQALLQVAGRERSDYIPLPKYPSITNDVSLRTTSDVSYGGLLAAVQAGIEQSRGDLVCHVEPLTIYQPENAGHKTTTFRIKAASCERTLTDEDLRLVMDAVAVVARERCKAELV